MRNITYKTKLMYYKHDIRPNLYNYKRGHDETYLSSFSVLLAFVRTVVIAILSNAPKPFHIISSQS